ncbi:hypothetical protein N185_15695 [Sinorhizobium sp. GW3]|nr:hypothetical protein N185_15695 [Sinorhizobium sp. GW3]
MSVTPLPDLSLRPATSSDAKILVDIQRSAVLKSFSQYYDQTTISAFLSLITTSRFALAPDQPSRLLVERDGVPVGYGAFWPTGKIDGIYVSAQHQRLGIGRRLVQAIEAKAREDRLSSISVEATLPAIDFYASLGFTRCREVERLLAITPLMSMRIVVMEKQLSKGDISTLPATMR